ncbi:response regulator [Asticcacaulis sp. AC460]|uniref:response regulator n=1 Tax=Asticcacaulis sp. AC460 TaxID=1282360 RepID=UPI000416906B|nr:response regulator [Asticcacaulis sp. AC460]
MFRGTEPAEPAPVKSETILLVDDRPANLMVYTSILEELGQTLMTAPSGEEALKLVLKHDFAVILLDVNMPTMNGFETAELIRKRRKSASTPIIFLTAFNDETAISQGYASGAVDFMPTPVVPEVLKAKVKVFIELSQMRRQAALQAEERARREAAEEAAQSFAFLAQVSDALARSQNRGEFMRTLVQLPVPHLADAALAWFKTEGEPDRIEWADSEGRMSASPAVLDRLEPAVVRALAEGRPQLFSDIVGGAMAYAQVLPLMVQGFARGVLVLGTRQNRPTISPLAGDLAYRAGVMLENVMLMEQIREADRRKDEFLGMLAHELRNPLGPIYNCLQLQKMLPPGDARITTVRDTMDRQVKHMGRLIDDLLDATRLAHGKILLRTENCDLNKIVQQTAEDYRTLLDGNHVSLKLVTPDEPVWVEGDPTRLLQVVGNLLHNANKFSQTGGLITITVDALPQGVARISVADTGIGIEPHMLRHVFDVFRQADQGLDRSRGGLGLGLALVKGLVQLHSGMVEARSDGLNRGAEFRITLPLAGQSGADLSDDGGSEVSVESLRILLIEDNVDAAESARMLLRHEGHEVEVAHDAMTGLDKARGFKPSVILCDIGLPVMDGYQIIRKIREDDELASIYVVALTGYGREADQRRALEAGFDLHLTKPIDFNTLRKALAQAQTPLVAAS